MRRVRQILFVAPAPVVWAQSRGLFASHGLDVETTPTVSSDQIGQGLADGVFDVGIGVMDNVVAWNAERGAGLKILAQLERTQPMAFCAAPQRASLVDAARGTIGVDSTTNGFVLVLYRALARAGIERAACTFEPVGGVRQRFEALVAGRIDATILVPPFVDLAVAQGCRALWRGEEVARDYPGVVAAAPAAWIEAHRDAAAAYVAALREANAWATDPASGEAALLALVASRHSPEGAARLVREAVPDLVPSRSGWDETIALRREAGLLPEGVASFDAICASLAAT